MIAASCILIIYDSDAVDTTIRPNRHLRKEKQVGGAVIRLTRDKNGVAECSISLYLRKIVQRY